jgi:hypothetical protein
MMLCNAYTAVRCADHFLTSCYPTSMARPLTCTRRARAVGRLWSFTAVPAGVPTVSHNSSSCKRVCWILPATILSLLRSAMIALRCWLPLRRHTREKQFGGANFIATDIIRDEMMRAGITVARPCVPVL